ncbi:hypothetical protein GCM10029992_40540 [Glycomyces albus]
MEGLDFGADHGPLDRPGGVDHAAGALVEAGLVGEIGVEPIAEVLGLADVDDPAVPVAETVDARFGWDRAGRGTVINCHKTRLYPAPDTKAAKP